MESKHASSSWHKRSESDSENEDRRDKLDSGLQSFSLLGSEMGMIEGGNAIKRRPSFGNKATLELVREISVLEFEITYLEQYLLSLYRKAFLQQTESLTLPPAEQAMERLSCSCSSGLNSKEDLPDSDQSNQLEKPASHRIHCGPPILPQHSSSSQRISPMVENLNESVQEFYSQTLSHSKINNTNLHPLKSEQEDTPEVLSLADCLGANIIDHLHKTSNSLSEEMVRCMCSIYYKIAYSTRIEHGLVSSSSSYFSSGDIRDSTLDVGLENSFISEGLKEFSGTRCGLFEITSFSFENWSCPQVEKMMEQYKSLVHRLDAVNPRLMNAVEKIAFWINIYNSMMMHIFVEHGVPQNNLKRVLIYSKASYMIGGCSISLDMIQSSILRCRTRRPGQWLRALLSTRTKQRPGDELQPLAIERPEPLVHFALCSGSHSDPAVRVYSPEKLYQQLEDAKVEYIRSWVGVQKDQKLVLPKILDYFARDKGLDQQSLLDMIELNIPDTLQGSKKQRSQKVIEWSPHRFRFRYLIHRDCATSYFAGLS